MRVQCSIRSLRRGGNGAGIRNVSLASEWGGQAVLGLGCDRLNEYLSCAQRLTASKVRSRPLLGFSFEHIKSCSTPYGIKGSIARNFNVSAETLSRAQRLTASKVRSPSIVGYRSSSPLLCSTPYGIKGSIANACRRGLPFQTVLNALRHQRFDRKTRRSARTSLSWCSTPYGIKGLIAVAFIFFVL